MKLLTRLFTGILALSLLLTMGLPAQARMKCWTNNEGVMECGEKVPPEFAQKGHKEISRQGLVLEEQERAKTDEELAEAARLAAIEAERQEKIAEQARKDKILLDTFSNEDDIHMTRDGKIAAITSAISLTQKRNEKIQQDLDKRRAAAEKEELGGNAPNEDLLKDIESLSRQLNNNKAYVAGKEKEIEALKKAYTEDIERFNGLRSGEIKIGSID